MQPTFTATAVVTWDDSTTTTFDDLTINTPFENPSYAMLREAVREAARNEAEPVAYMISRIDITELECPGCGLDCPSEEECGCHDGCWRHGTDIGKAMRLIQDAVNGSVAPKAELQAAYELVYKAVYPTVPQ